VAGKPVLTHTYAVVAPFFTVVDDLSLSALQAYWSGANSTIATFFNNELRRTGVPTLLLDDETRALLERQWGKLSSASKIQIVQHSEMLTKTNQITGAIAAVVPFDELAPYWKLLTINQQNLFDKQLDITKYPLTLRVFADGDAGLLNAITPNTNRDISKLSVVAMTGVTALTRGTAVQMERKGVLYPGLLIRDWLRSADIAHISNEVSFWFGCPSPSFENTFRFCSATKYVELLKDIGTDVIELTGNHLWDYGYEHLITSLTMYDNLGWRYFGGGRTLSEANRVLTMTVNGNKLAFVGCNWFGANWATEKLPGSMRCGTKSQYDMDLINGLIRDAKQQGYLIIATIQYEEYYDYPTSANQRRDFQSMREAGAVVVNGSQGHHAQGFDVNEKGFIHYGTGNLFFGDQPGLGTHQTFVDRHVFYNGKYLGVEIKTAFIEDFSQPRPMRPEERSNFLKLIFAVR
jgi:poly-gamma-glutamate synthesis protein (capsule biosynthesis protein)